VPSVAIVAGEASGDASGGALALQLQKLRPGIELWGAGGPRMRDAGVELLADFTATGAIGIVESLKLVPRLSRELAKLKKVFLERRPDVFVPIDFGAFNIRLGKFAREHAVPTVYYFPPGSWRRRPKDPSSLLAAADKVITPFPWSADFLSGAGADAVFLGHPMLDRVAPKLSRKRLIKELKLRKDRRIVGLLPGSRSHEIRNILPALLKASAEISERIPSVGAYLVPASSEQAVYEITRIMVRTVAREWRSSPLRLDAAADSADGGDDLLAQYRAIVDSVYDVMAHSDLVITCSGTATLEAMILGTPMIIVYRGSRAMKLEYLFRKGILEEFIGMPNIIAGREICPELVGDEASPQAIAKLAISLLESPEELQKMRRELESARRALGEPGATKRAARLVLETAGLLSSS
jgi:lipid-A-disaccharide synthase